MTAPADLRPLVSRLKWRQLALLVALAERRSLRRAAADLAMTQPAATKLLRDVEDAFGHVLFVRHPWGMEPTAYGETLVRYARGLTAELGEARRELDAMAGGAEGVLRVGCATGAMPGLVAPALRRMQAARPRVSIYVLVNATEVLLDALRHGRLDVAVCPLPMDANVDGLVVVPLGDEPLRIVARTGHPLAKARRVPAAALAGVPWIVHTPGTPLRLDTDAMLAAAGLRLPAGVIETVSIVATLALLQDSDAVTAMPKALADHYGGFGMVAPLSVDLPAPAARYELVTRASRELAPVAQAFVELLQAPDARLRRSRR
ncbi:MAG TPA: LysR family transcriptional regulator [Casimicrobiaceae bacterium]|nr:LysR family transcriptional regulator [Casimicrobiaceae bacterium]